MPPALARHTVVVFLAVVTILTPASQATPDSMIPPEKLEKTVLITVGNWMGPMTAIHVQCRRNFDENVLWWKEQRWDDYLDYYLFYGDLASMKLEVPVQVQSTAVPPEQQYRCRLKVSKRYECEYLVVSSRKDHLERCSTAVGGCTWVVKPDGLYFKSGNGTEQARLVRPHCSEPDLDYSRLMLLSSRDQSELYTDVVEGTHCKHGSPLPLEQLIHEYKTNFS